MKHNHKSNVGLHGNYWNKSLVIRVTALEALGPGVAVDKDKGQKVRRIN